MSQPNAFAQLETDLSADAKAIFANGKTGIKSEVDAAVSLISKAITTAAGDTAGLITDAEAGVINLIVDNVPTAYQPIVASFLQAFAGSAEAPLNADAQAAVTKGLTIALAWLSGLQSLLDGLTGGSATAPAPAETEATKVPTTAAPHEDPPTSAAS